MGHIRHVEGWAADRASHWSQPVDLGGVGTSFRWVREWVEGVSECWVTVFFCRGNGDFPRTPRPGRAAALDLAEGVKGWPADRASLCSQPVGLGGVGRNFLWGRAWVGRAPDH